MATTTPIPFGLAIPPDLLAMKPRALWAAAKRLPASWWMLTIYIFFEYVRPQSIYPALDVLPLARLALLGSVALAAFETSGVRKLTLLDGGMALYTLVVILSLVGAFDPKWGLDNAQLYVSWVIVYFLLSTTMNSQTRLFLLLLSWFVWNLKMTQHAMRDWASIGFAFRDWGVTGAPGWFENSGEFGIQMCVVMPISLYFALGIRPYVSKWTFFGFLVLPSTALLGSIASSSRGALLGMAGVGLWMLARSKYKLRATVGFIAVGLVFVVMIPPEQVQRLSNSGSDATSEHRLRYWERGFHIANQHPILGVGHENWYPYYNQLYGSTLAPNERVQLPHNIFVECMAELGYTGLFSLLFLMVSTWVTNARTRRLAKKLGRDGHFAWHLAWGFDGGLIGYIISGFFVTVLYYPYLWVNLGMTVAHHLSVRRQLRAHQFRESVDAPLRAWTPPATARQAAAMRLGRGTI